MVGMAGISTHPYQNSLSPIPLSSVQLAGIRIGEVAAEELLLWLEKKKKPQPVRKLKSQAPSALSANQWIIYSTTKSYRLSLSNFRTQ